nr:glycosyltransferase [uncultured Cupriavidus sp.]
MIDIYHNMLWPKYKGAVFSEAFTHARGTGHDVRFFHISATGYGRSAYSSVDTSYHRYPYQILFDEPYETIPRWKVALRLMREVWRSESRLILMPGYHRVEFWAMLAACMLRGKRRGVFCDSTMRDQADHPVKRRMKRFFFRQCDGIFVYGQRSAEYVIAMGADPAKIVYRCQAAALPHTYSPEDAAAQRLANAAPADAPRFLFVGLVCRAKGIEDLLHAFVEVRRQQPAATLVLAGPLVEAEQLPQLAESLGIADAVQFLGSMDISQLAQQYSQATCLVLPSHTEAWGLVVNEALSYGCPVVASDCCGCIPELIQEGVTGHTFATRDTNDLARALMQATRSFADVQATMQQCLNVAGQYTPACAGRSIMEGCMKILEDARA